MQLLGEVLLKEKLIEEDKLKLGLKKQRENGKRLGEVLLAEGLITDEKLAFGLSRQLNVPLLTAEGLIKIDKTAMELIPEFFAREYHCLAFGQDQDNLHVVMVDPEDIVVIDNLHKITAHQIAISIAPQLIIDEAIERHYKELRTTGEVS